MSQSHDILRYLQAGNTVDPMLALAKFNCLRLAARIHELRSDGNEILTTERALNNGKTVGEYRLIGSAKHGR